MNKIPQHVLKKTIFVLILLITFISYHHHYLDPIFSANRNVLNPIIIAPRDVQIGQNVTFKVSNVPRLLNANWGGALSASGSIVSKSFSTCGQKPIIVTVTDDKGGPPNGAPNGIDEDGNWGKASYFLKVIDVPSQITCTSAPASSGLGITLTCWVKDSCGNVVKIPVTVNEKVYWSCGFQNGNVINIMPGTIIDDRTVSSNPYNDDLLNFTPNSCKVVLQVLTISWAGGSITISRFIIYNNTTVSLSNTSPCPNCP